MLSLLERAQRETTPLIDGTIATFLWQGNEPPHLVGDFTHWNRDDTPHPQPEPVAHNLWQYRVTLPENAYVQYAFFSDLDSEASRIPDPLNPRLVWNGVQADNNWFEMPAAHHTPLLKAKRGISRGTVTRHALTPGELVVGKRRDLWLYQPPVIEPVPLLFAYDGRDYLRQAKLPTIVDNLIAAGRIAPVALAMVDNARQHRFVEYHTSEAMLATLQPVIELARSHLNLLDIAAHPGAYGVLGASLGGLMALFTGLRLPDYFGKVFSQAGAFDIAPMPGVEPLIYDLARLLPPPPLEVWQDVGSLDWLLQTNRTMRDLLLEKGYSVTYREYAAGHNYIAWRDALPEALETLFPPR
jgi:enterochelin esterase family protein